MYPKNGKVILHVDMNSFYASVEMANNPALKGKPLAIAGNPKERRGIIVTSSYEARQKGVKTTMSVWEGKRLCPDLIIKKPNFPLYREASYRIFEILSQYTALVQPVSIDEGYLDITNCYDQGSPVEIATRIQLEIKQELDLPCSIGIAPNKFLAKMASDMKKPMGITILRKRDIPNKLWPLNVEEMYGVGQKTAKKLNEMGIYTIKDLAYAQEGKLKERLGINGVRLKERANGEDHRPVDPEAVSNFKSIGNSTTLPADTKSENNIQQVLKRLSESVSRRMKKQHVVSWNIQLTIRYGNRKTITRSRKLKNPIQDVNQIYHAAIYLFEEHWDGKPVRLLGITAQDLDDKDQAYHQLDLFSFEQEAKKEPLYNAISKLKEKYGKRVIVQGINQNNFTFVKNDKHDKGTSFQKDFLRNFKPRDN